MVRRRLPAGNLARFGNAGTVRGNVDRDRSALPIGTRAQECLEDLRASTGVFHLAENDTIGAELGSLLALRIDHSAFARHVVVAA